MKRVKPHVADELRSRIDSGELVLTLEVALMIDGSCKLFEPRPPAQPTCHKPGSAAKIEVLRQRVANGESLWHELDDRSPVEPSDRLPVYVAGIRELQPVAEVA